MGNDAAAHRESLDDASIIEDCAAIIVPLESEDANYITVIDKECAVSLDSMDATATSPEATATSPEDAAATPEDAAPAAPPEDAAAPPEDAAAPPEDATAPPEDSVPRETNAQPGAFDPTFSKSWLQDVWSFYVHSPDETSWTLESYHRLGDVSTVEDLRAMHRAVAPFAAHGMIFAMREHVFPCWDDKSNIDGGCLSLKVPLGAVAATWDLLVKRVAGETLGATAATPWDAVNGLSISPKRGFCIIKLWLRADAYPQPPATAPEATAAAAAAASEGARRIGAMFKLPAGYHGDLIFRSNRENMQMDANKAHV
jgi:hypothetical protein